LHKTDASGLDTGVFLGFFILGTGEFRAWELGRGEFRACEPGRGEFRACELGPGEFFICKLGVGEFLPGAMCISAM